MNKEIIEKEKLMTVIQDFSELSEMAKYPPFSTVKGPNVLLARLNRKFEDFVNGISEYDSFAEIETEFADAISEASAWSKLFSDPEKAAIEYLRRSQKQQGAPDDLALSIAKGIFQRNGKSYGPTKIIPDLAQHMGFSGNDF